MRKSRIFAAVVSAALLAIVASGSVLAGSGFDQYGYNTTARIFNGTGSSWCVAGGQAVDCMGAYSNDKLVMKWNAAWDACNLDPSACSGAWEDNEWNGKGVKNGSGAIWHYKIVWVGPCVDGEFFADGGYCVWGAYEVLMDQGVDPSIGPGHTWFAHATPNGYGSH